MKTVITYGTFDLLHTGHVNLLKRARKLGDRLIVGVTTDSYDQSRGKLNVMESLEERMENVRKTGLADLIIKEELEGQKIHDIRKYGADVFVIGSDWSGKFDYLRDYCEVVYLERTKGVSSTDLRSARNPIVYMGIAGHGRIAGRFLRESKYVSNIEITAVFGRNEEKVRRFAESHALLEYYTEYEQFLPFILPSPIISIMKWPGGPCCGGSMYCARSLLPLPGRRRKSCSGWPKRKESFCWKPLKLRFVRLSSN